MLGSRLEWTTPGAGIARPSGSDRVHEPNRFINKKVNPLFYFIFSLFYFFSLFLSSNSLLLSTPAANNGRAAVVSLPSSTADRRLQESFRPCKDTPVKLSSSSFTLSECIFEMNSIFTKMAPNPSTSCCRSNHPCLGSTGFEICYSPQRDLRSEPVEIAVGASVTGDRSDRRDLSGSQPPTSPYSQAMIEGSVRGMVMEQVGRIWDR
ncbi:hypothetical protein GQ457_06G012230 [Hibiscus cannabinus]